MECNKEEAIRAKGIAAKKMESKDFAGARKVATKAQHLYPDLENISQMICVCEVHCSAENIMFGNELDWYGILQVNQTADDALIKKQYRKLALLLHPDKNKFAGAEAAFKLIGEAQRMLLDKEKRSFYDLKRKTTISRPMAASNRPPQGNRNSTSVKQPWAQNNFASNTGSYVKGFSSSSPSPYQQAQSAVPNGKETFWTLCPFCGVRYQYYKDVLNRAICCQACNKPFIAYDMCAQGLPPGPSANQTAKYSQAEAHSQNHSSLNNNRFPGNLGPQKPKMDSFAKAETQKPKMDSFAKTENNTEVQGLRKTNASPKVAKRANKARVSEGSNSLRKANGKRGKKRVSESSESFQSESSTDSGCEEVEVEAPAAQDLKVEGESNRRRSARSKRRVSYNENGSDEEDMQSPAKRPKVYRSSSFTGAETVDASSEEEPGERTEPPGLNEKVDKIREKVNDDASLAKESRGNSSRVDHDSAANSSAEASETVLHEYPDPDFSDFDQVRNEDCFKVGQIWAAYDTLDAMPRFYAQIRKVFSPGFKLRITWLEADPVEENEVRWVSKELPVSCGRYRYGDSENTENRLMFSHPISWEKGSGKGAIKIYPKKEETWALFKDWHLGWICDPDNSRKYEYEFVEVLSDYDETLGIRVAFLVKLKGFASLFCRQGGDKLQIPPSELLRFSHRVLSFKMTGRERDDVPGGSFELDPACISTDLVEIPVPPEMTGGAEDHISNGSSSKSVEVTPDTKVQSKASSGQNDQVNAEHNSYVDVDDLATTQEFCLEEADEIPEPEFFDFEAAKALDKFQTGQVWALYSDADGLPKYYAQIKKIDPHSDITLQILWLEPCSLPCDLTMWKDKEMPISCGIFKIKSLKSQWYFDSSPFSHQVLAQATLKRNVFEIYPREGEIWALHKNWNAEMTVSELVSCEYDFVEVQERNVDNLFTRVSVLEQVSGFNSVFKSRADNSSSVSLEVSHSELLRFSHQIPSYKLTNEKGGSLSGCWELDPNALPSSFFCKS